jgi:hypothetical protein
MYNRDKLSLASIEHGWKDLGTYMNEYLESRIKDPVPQTTYKRFLVSRHRPDLCDLLDDIRDSKIPSPSWFSEFNDYQLTVRPSDLFFRNLKNRASFFEC